MYKDIVQKHINRLEKEIRTYQDLEESQDIDTLFGICLADIDHQREELTSLMADLVRVYNIEPELRHEIADFLTSALEDNRSLEVHLTRIVKYLKEKGKKEQDEQEEERQHE